MSSESNGQKPESQAPAPLSGVGHRASARAPSAWGAVRDALAAVHNLEALLRSASVSGRTIADLVPELRNSAAVLRTAFSRPDDTDAADKAVSMHGRNLVDGFDGLLDSIEASQNDRDTLADAARSLAGDLEGSADLLALLDRASEPVSTELSLDLVAREAGRMSGPAHGREITIQFDEASPDAVIHTDPYVIGPVLSLMVAYVRAAGIHALVLRARSQPQSQFIVEAATLEDAGLPILTMRVTRWVPPSELAARRVAEQLGATLDFGDRRVSIVF